MASPLHQVYSTYALRSDAFLPLKSLIPGWSEIRRIGVVGLGDDPETCLWKPFDGRRVIYVNAGPRHQAASLQPEVLIGRAEDLEGFLEASQTIKVKEAIKIDLILKAQVGPQQWSAVVVEPGDSLK